MATERCPNADKCHKCAHMRPVPGDCHIQCAKPDLEMTVDPHGVKHGWCFYPVIFDPIWLTKPCSNYEERK